MDTLRPLRASPTMQKLCAQQQGGKLLKQDGPLRTFEAGKLDHQILRQFKNDYVRGAKISEGGDFIHVKEYGPLMLHTGSMSSRRYSTNVFIPIAPRDVPAANALPQPTVLYQPDNDNNTIQEPTLWHIGTHIQIPGNSRIVVKEVPIWFMMVVFVGRLDEDVKEKVEDVLHDGHGQRGMS
ncbi:hypothetical protein EV126DRAFT_334371 [Verticillium dahliae]|nr:hypothetical protein EV126DRAFT_334371 [Verticillium dahliae]